MVRDILYTNGVKYVAEEAGAYWLIGEIDLAQGFDKLIAAEEFQSWKLVVNADPRRSPARTATAASCSQRRSNSRIFRLRRSPCFS